MVQLPASSHPDIARPTTVIVVVGAAGEEGYGTEFRESAALWRKASDQAGAKCVVIGAAEKPGTNDLIELRAALASEPTNSLAELWVVFLGHGTWDGKQAKFNLNGPDISGEELANELKTFSRPIAVINTASASGPWIKILSHTNRIVLTGTRGGGEQNYARFGRYLSQSVASPAADLDKDQQTSLLEAFLMGSRHVMDFYKNEGRLATEHALLDDNGDGLGTPADWFRGVRAVKTPAAGGAIDGMRAHQWHLVRSAEDQRLTPEERQRRDGLEIEIQKLRGKKAQMKEEDYYRELERLLNDLSPLIVK